MERWCPSLRTRGWSGPNEEVVEVLKRLSADPKNEIVIISGRDRKTLEEWFAGFRNWPGS